MICMWGVAVLLSYFFGITLGMGLLGVWLAQGLDEWIRGLFALNAGFLKAGRRKNHYEWLLKQKC